MFVIRLTFTKMLMLLLYIGHVVLILCKMTREQLVSSTQKSMKNTQLWCTRVSS